MIKDENWRTIMFLGKNSKVDCKVLYYKKLIIVYLFDIKIKK